MQVNVNCSLRFQLFFPAIFSGIFGYFAGLFAFFIWLDWVTRITARSRPEHQPDIPKPDPDPRTIVRLILTQAGQWDLQPGQQL